MGFSAYKPFETDDEIMKNAPSDATHYDVEVGCYLKLNSEGHCLYCFANSEWRYGNHFHINGDLDSKHYHKRIRPDNEEIKE